MTGPDRRTFLRQVALGGAAFSIGSRTVHAGAAQAGASRPLDTMLASAVIVDEMAGFSPDPKLPDQGFGVIKESGVTIVSPTLGSVVPAESRDSCLAAMKRLDETVKKYGDRMVLIRSVADVETARKGRLGVLINWQNSTAIGTDIKALDEFFALGVRQIQITFNWRNWVGDGCTERTQAGLSYFGLDLVKRMNELGILVDVSHSGIQTTLDAVEASTKPIVFSHTNCKALNDHPRNKSDDQIRALAKKGGVIGISSFNWFVSDKPKSSLDDLLNHYDHAIKLVGPDHVGIGSDFGLPGWAGTEPDEEWERHARIYDQREWKAIKGRFPPYIAEVNDAQRYRTIARGLEKRGHSTDTIEKVLGLNFLRVYREVLPA